MVRNTNIMEQPQHFQNFPAMTPGQADGNATKTGDVTPLPNGPLVRGIDVLRDVPLRVTIELGRTRLLIRDVLGLRPGSLVELDRAAGAAVDILVNGIVIARGEVVVVDEHYGVRISEVLSTSQLGEPNR